MPRQPGQDDFPYSQRQERWAFATERSGDLPKGTALRWAKRRKQRQQHGEAAYGSRKARR